MHEEQDTHNADSRSTRSTQFQSEHTKNRSLWSGNVEMRSTFCVEHFTMNEHRSLVFARILPASIPPTTSHSPTPGRVKNPSIKAFYSWTMPNLFYVAHEIESLSDAAALLCCEMLKCPRHASFPSKVNLKLQGLSEMRNIFMVSKKLPVMGLSLKT